MEQLVDEMRPGPSAAVVSGAASGVGLATTRRLLARGLQVIGVDLAPRPDDLTGDVAWVQGSTADPGTWSAALDAAPTPPTVVVLNAAVLITGSVLDLSPEDWQRQFDVNVTGPFHALRTLLPPMIAAGGGSVVTIASVDAYQAEQELVGYCSSKGALLQLTRCVAMDHARQGVRANCIAPGVIDTPFFRRHLDTAADPARFLEVREQRNPMGRLLTPDDVASTVEHVALDASGMTGALITVDGGLSTSFDFRTGRDGD